MQRNACKLCAPLGASLVLRGIDGSMPFLHGSQGCATYIRRYMISHFREPLDIASSSFHEETAIFGGRQELLDGIRNVYEQYSPKLIGVVSTCLAETIGEDTQALINQMKANNELPKDVEVVFISAPSYAGSHTDGFRKATKALVDTLCVAGDPKYQINILPAFLSTEDLRYLREAVESFDVPAVVLPDYSSSLDGEIWDSYQRLPKGGEKLEKVKSMGCSLATIELGSALDDVGSAGDALEKKYAVPNYRMSLPIGVKATDRFLNSISSITEKAVSGKYLGQRGRLIDSYVDAHKYLAGKKAAIFGDEDLVVGLAGFLAEIGVTPVLCASGSMRSSFTEAVREAVKDVKGHVEIKGNVDFMDIEEDICELKPDILIGNSKGYTMARRLDIPLMRVGFPIHDRVGAQRILHLGYQGTQQLFDQIVNIILERSQRDSSVGYTYI